MRVLLAIDGSTASQTASGLVGHLPWPAGSTVRIVSAVPITVPIVTAPGEYLDFETLAIIEQAQLDTAGEFVAAASAAIGRDGLAVETALPRGAATGAILAAAADFRADLLVVGSRGHGTRGSVLLGSVSAGLVDHAPCPVLVARRPQLARLVLALDGSAAAADALEVVATWPIFSSAAATVVTVIAPTPLIVRGVEAKLDAALARLAGQQRVNAQQLADAAVTRLLAAGLTAAGRVLDGDPAQRITEAAAADQADLVVTGSLGLTGSTRVRLGSVTRRVLHASSTSVLVVRPPDGGMATSGVRGEDQ